MNIASWYCLLWRIGEWLYIENLHNQIAWFCCLILGTTKSIPVAITHTL